MPVSAPPPAHPPPAQPGSKPAPPKVDLGDESGLGVAQIVITAATPMVEEPEQGFPAAADPEPEESVEDEESSLSEQTAVCAGAGGAGEGEATAPHSPPGAGAPRAGRASIPDELDSAQLARLTDLKESNA